jgi:Ca-activated chloride channel family protein
MTNGKFYRAQSRSELKKIYHDIDQLEKTKITSSSYSKHYEAFQPLALAAILVLLLEVLLRITIFRRIP